MQEIARFLAARKPFDGLAPEALEQTAATVEVAYFPRGASILRQGGEPSRHLYVIVKSTVELRQVDERGASELVETLAEGETFGQVSLLSRSPHLWDVVARDDVLAYLIPAEQVERLRHQPGFEALLARRAGDRLRHAVAVHRELAPLDLFSVRADELVSRPLVTATPTTRSPRPPGACVTSRSRRWWCAPSAWLPGSDQPTKRAGTASSEPHHGSTVLPRRSGSPARSGYGRRLRAATAIAPATIAFSIAPVMSRPASIGLTTPATSSSSVRWRP